MEGKKRWWRKKGRNGRRCWVTMQRAVEWGRWREGKEWGEGEKNQGPAGGGVEGRKGSRQRAGGQAGIGQLQQDQPVSHCSRVGNRNYARHPPIQTHCHLFGLFLSPLSVSRCHPQIMTPAVAARQPKVQLLSLPLCAYVPPTITRCTSSPEAPTRRHPTMVHDALPCTLYTAATQITSILRKHCIPSLHRRVSRVALDWTRPAGPVMSLHALHCGRGYELRPVPLMDWSLGLYI